MGNIFNADFSDFIVALNDNNVDYILVGGFAVILHGHSRVTGDMDIWVKRTSENYEKLMRAFNQFHMPAFDMTKENFLNHEDWDVFKFGRKPSAIDVMIKVKGLDFDECFKLSKIFEADGLSIRTLHLNNLIQAKKEAGRLKDLDDIQQLTKNKILSFVNILVANAVDAEMIADLSYRTFYDAFGPFNTKENMDKFIRNDFNRKKLISQISEPGNIFLLAYQHDELTGYVRLFESHNPPELGETDAIEISRIYVENKITSKGIGSALMQKCIDVAQEKNKKIIWLGVWEHNARAIAFYKKWGFEIFGDHIFMLGDDAQTDVLMKKNL